MNVVIKESKKKKVNQILIKNNKVDKPKTKKEKDLSVENFGKNKKILVYVSRI